MGWVVSLSKNNELGVRCARIGFVYLAGGTVAENALRRILVHLWGTSGVFVGWFAVANGFRAVVGAILKESRWIVDHMFCSGRVMT